jgi:putative Mg2+ transporter-C (MgtC) family protein
MTEILTTALESLRVEWGIISDMNLLCLLGVSAVSGALVGIEREKAEKPAGLRTNIMICVGSTLFTIASILSWRFLAGASDTVDPGRISAQVVSGVGFIGAGVILKTELNNIVGITTAATIWLVAGIGMVIGLGFPLLGLISAVGTTLTLLVLGKLEFSVWFSPKKEED